MDAERFKTHNLTDMRIQRILSAALKAVDPVEAVRSHLPDVSGNVYGLGVGKASIPMLTALAPLSWADTQSQTLTRSALANVLWNLFPHCKKTIH